MAALFTRTDASEDTWESLKEAIRLLYLDENLPLEGPGGVMEKMAQNYHFHASKPQYERFFRKWKFRKNLPKEGWVAIAQTLRKREQDGLQSEVYILSKLVSEKRIRKESSRYKADIESTNGNESTHSLPSIVRIATPVKTNTTKIARSSTGYDRNLNAADIGSSQIELNGLSIFEFEKCLHEYGYHLPSEGIRFYHSGSPSIFQQFHNKAIRDSTSLPYRTSFRFRSNTFPQICQSNEYWTQTEFFHPQSELQSNLGNQQLSNSIQPLKLLVFLLTNNLANTDTVNELLRHATAFGNLRALRTFLLHPGDIADLFAGKLFPYAIKAQNTALVKCLLERGMDPDDYVVESEYTINELTLVVSRRLYSSVQIRLPMTPLAFASKVRNAELIRTLLNAGADVNKPVICGPALPVENGEHDFDVTCFTPLSLAIRPSSIHDFSPEEDPVDEIVLTLLEAGANINPSLNIQRRIGYVLPLSQAAIAGHCATLKLFLENGAHINRTDWNGETALIKSLRSSEKLGLETASKVQKALIQAGADINYVDWTSIEDLSGKFWPKSPIDLAACNGNIEVFELIWNINPTTSKHTIGCAVVSGNLQLVQQVLQMIMGSSMIKECFTGLELCTALEKERLDIAELLCQCKVLPYREESVRKTLEHAARTGQHRIIELVLAIALENQDNWDLSRITNVGPAMSAGQYDIAEYLINCGGRVANEALIAAFQTGNEIFVQKLLELYEDPEHPNPGLLKAATKLGNPTILKTVLDSGLVDELRSEETVQCIDAAIRSRKLDILQILLNAGVYPGYGHTCQMYDSPLASAASRSDMDGIRILLNAGADPTDPKALREAVLTRNLCVVRLLLEACSKSNNTSRKPYGCTALKAAVDEGHVEMVRELLLHGVCPKLFHYSSERHMGLIDIYEIAENAMGAAIRLDRPVSLSILSEILSTCMDPNSIVIRYPARTALILAIEMKNLPAVKLLIDSGANVNLPATRRTKRTPLQAACEAGYLEAVVLLLSHKADINAPPADIRGATALQFAAIRGHVGIASLLINNGADINAPAAKVQGRTALEGAAEHGRFDMVKLLLNAGVCITGRGEKQYLRAVKFASTGKHEAVKKILELASTCI